MVARNTSSYLPLAGSSSSSPSSSRSASGRMCGPSSSALSSLARKLKRILLVLVAFVILLQLLVLLPYFAGEERMKGWGLESVPHPAPPQWMQPGSWATGPPGPPGHGPPGHGPPGRPDDHPPWDDGEDHFTGGATPIDASIAFPPPYHKTFQTFDYAHNSDANPHLGQIPALHLNVLNSVPVLVAPPFPPKAPEINSSVYNLRPWDKELKGSNTTWQDSFKAHLQPMEEDPRSAPFSGWKPPLAMLDTSKPPAEKLGKVQFAFTDPTRRSGKQGDEAREKLLAERQRLVRNAFLHAWSGYKRLAWGHDELRPVSEKAQDNFNGWGATIVDALDTLLVMDLPGEYDLARSHVRDIDFALIGGERSAYGSSDGRLPVFETAIRYLGGMLAAYDLSGDELMKDRAEELAQRLEAAFDTRSGVPVGRIRLAEDINQPRPGRGSFGSTHSFSSVVLSEAGSMLLEYTRLWQATGNRAYYDRVQRVTDWFDRNMTEGAGQGGLLYNIIFPEQHTGSGSLSFGGMSDSYYEYLIKEHQLLGGRVPQYGRMYSAAMETARGFIIRDVHSVPNTSLLVPGSFEHKTWHAKLEHLACFTGAMAGLGAKLMPKERGKDYAVAQRISETCWWAYNSTNTGIGPEYTIFYEEYKPHRGKNGKNVGKYGQNAKPSGWPIEGIRGQLPDYRGRPETIESVFYMWRITGDPVWQERGWQMFSSWVTHSMTNVGFANIQDVNKVPAPLTDSMESFVFAETFKYYYLLFSPPDLISLDDYVLTTEAHPLLVPQNGKWAQPEAQRVQGVGGACGREGEERSGSTGQDGTEYGGADG
ncbi:seven-hairpin glycosidase [Microstroma glucosiphilum]|uniref:alpha-1,2-Mannosidase n=1 Tax=Pseudomicrostroma glucosiphilum TaxID=1684307 RepID=A0A316U3W4_9BASI|nr:seven-hairpin glycosidase [Pseudomicrostroma glucosiphilum]PWN19063.1 seven-hairpin glycosidase [Pseudomicrostroma glucosiphilum]